MRIAGTTVHTNSSRVLPWIGAPSCSSCPGRMRNCQTEYRMTVVTSTKTGTHATMST